MADSEQDRQLLLERLRSGPMFEKWHWLQWNFSPDHYYEPCVTLDALLICGRAMRGFADDMLGRLERIGGRDRDLDDYEQIKQWLGELLVVHHFVSYPWTVPVTFDHEPVADGSKQNPEMTVNASGFRLGIEVKTPDLRGPRRAAQDRRLAAPRPDARHEGGAVGRCAPATGQPRQGLPVKCRQQVRRLPRRRSELQVCSGHCVERRRQRADQRAAVAELRAPDAEQLRQAA